MKITIENEEAEKEILEAEQFYLLTLNFKGVMNEDTGATFTVPHYHHRSHGDLRELSKEIREKLEEFRHADRR